MICSVCKLPIHDFDFGDSFEAINPITFKKANFHSECFELTVELAKQMPAKQEGYQNRLDEYLTTKI